MVVTAYDVGSARLVERAGVDAILVGDSLGMTVLGHDDTLRVTMDDMVRHTAAVSRGASRAMVVGDMPFLSWQVSTEEALRLLEQADQRLPIGQTRGELAIDLEKRKVRLDGKLMDLTAKEFALLRYFMTRAGDVLSQEELLEHVWDENADPFTNVVRVTIMTLRRKLGDPPLVETVAGVGYKA